MSNPNTANKEMKVTTRGVLVGAVGAVALAAVTIQGVSHAANILQDKITEHAEINQYSQKDLFDKNMKSGFDKESVVLTVGAADINPDQFAHNLHLSKENEWKVTQETAEQVGGASRLHFGDRIVLPTDQLNMAVLEVSPRSMENSAEAQPVPLYQLSQKQQ